MAKNIGLYGVVGTAILLLVSVLAGTAAALLTDWHIGVMIGVLVGVLMIPGSDFILQRTEWGRKHSEGSAPPEPRLYRTSE